MRAYGTYRGSRGRGWGWVGAEDVRALITPVLHARLYIRRYLLPAAIRAEEITNQESWPRMGCSGVCYYDYLDCLLSGVLLVIRHYAGGRGGRWAAMRSMRGDSEK